MRRRSSSMEAKILAVADVFQALAQKRPYRGPLPPEEILTILREQSVTGKLDALVVARVGANLQACWRAATMQHTGLSTIPDSQNLG